LQLSLGILAMENGLASIQSQRMELPRFCGLSVKQQIC